MRLEKKRFYFEIEEELRIIGKITYHNCYWYIDIGMIKKDISGEFNRYFL